MFLIAAISIGFLGSFHCIGMCGPIALALPINNKSFAWRILSILTYNSGRIITYSVFGLVIGLFGQSLVLIGLQQYLSLLLGFLILIAVIFSKTFAHILPLNGKLNKWTHNIKKAFSFLFSQRSLSALFFIGLLNGLLPCGLVYLAVAGALTTGTPFKSALFMALFGLGTVPVMLSVSFFSGYTSLKFRSAVRKTIPVVVSVMAIMLILRGLNLGIPYVSPKLENEKQTNSLSQKKVLKCCHK